MDRSGQCEGQRSVRDDMKWRPNVIELGKGVVSVDEEMVVGREKQEMLANVADEFRGDRWYCL